jgi:hypothetical protein
VPEAREAIAQAIAALDEDKRSARPAARKAPTDDAALPRR